MPSYVVAIRKLLENEADFVVVGEARRGSRSRRKSEPFTQDVLLLDLKMVPVSGMEILRSIEDVVHDVRVIILADDMNSDELVEALRLGARGSSGRTWPRSCSQKHPFGDVRGVLGGSHERRASGAGSEGGHPISKRGGEFSIISASRDARYRSWQRSWMGAPTGISRRNSKFSEQTVKHHLHHIFNKARGHESSRTGPVCHE